MQQYSIYCYITLDPHCVFCGENFELSSNNYSGLKYYQKVLITLFKSAMWLPSHGVWVAVSNWSVMSTQDRRAMQDS